MTYDHLVIEVPEQSVQPAEVAEFMLALADDELLMGHRHSEWLGLSPFLEEDLTMSSIAQDELGHARALYGLLWPTWPERDAQVVRRHASAWRSCALVEQGGLNWEQSFVRHLAYDHIEPFRWRHLAALVPTPEVAGLVDRVLAEERFHARHARQLWDRLVLGSEEARERLQVAVTAQWPLVGSLCDGLGRESLDEVTRLVTDAGLMVPEPPEFANDHRLTRSDGFFDAQASLLDVIAFDAAATW